MIIITVNQNDDKIIISDGNNRPIFEHSTNLSAYEMRLLLARIFDEMFKFPDVEPHVQLEVIDEDTIKLIDEWA